MFNFSVLDQKKIKNLMREGCKKKHLRKKNTEPIFEKLMRGRNKKNIGQISRKVYEGDLFKKTLLRAMEKKQVKKT